MKNSKQIKVLIALDYDPGAKAVAEAGFGYAKMMSADVILLHVISDPIYYATPEYSPLTGFAGYDSIVNMSLDKEADLRIKSLHFLGQFKAHFGGQNTQTLISEGDYSSEILATAKQQHADMIVMGSHSHNWFENVVLGSVTSKVMNDTTIPVLIIPAKAKTK